MGWRPRYSSAINGLNTLAANWSALMRPIRPCAIAAVALSLIATHALPAQAACKRFGFLVNDYGKEGPTKDAKALLDIHIKKWTAEKGITNFKIGNKQVKCELFLDVGLFDEYTCTAKASVCWGEGQANAATGSGATGTAAANSATANNTVADDDDDFELPPAPLRKATAAPEMASPVAPAQILAKEDDAPKTAEQAAEEAEAAAQAAVAAAEKAAMEAQSASKTLPSAAGQAAASTADAKTAAGASAPPAIETANTKPTAAPPPIIETGALPTNSKAAAAEVAKTSPEMTKGEAAVGKVTAAVSANERAAAAEAAAAAAERAAKAAEEAAAAAKAAAAAAIAASEASQGGPVVPALE